MTFDKTQLLSVLKKALPGIDDKFPLIQGADSFTFCNNNVHTFNDNISIACKFESDLVGSVKAKEFYNIINKFPEKEIKIIVADSSWLLKCGSIKAEFALIDTQIMDYIDKITPKEDDWHKIPNNFMDCIKYAYIGGNNSQLSGICIKDFVITSTDEMRVNWYKLTAPMDYMWIPNAFVKQLLGISDVAEYNNGDSWIHFRNNDGVLFSCKKLGGKYPIDTITSLIKKHDQSNDDVTGEFPSELAKAIDRASSFSIDMESYKTIKLEFSNKNLIVSAERTSGNYSEKVEWTKEIEKEFDPVTIYIDYNMIMSGLDFYTSFYLKESEVQGSKTTKVILGNANGIQLIGTLSK